MLAFENKLLYRVIEKLSLFGFNVPLNSQFLFE